MFLSWSFIPLGLWLKKKTHVICVGMQSWVGLFDKIGWESVVYAVGQRGNWIIPGWEGTSGNSLVSSKLWLGEFYGLNSPPWGVNVWVCAWACIYVWGGSFPFACICVDHYVSLEWDTVQSAHCSFCQKVAQLSSRGRRCASASLFSIVSAARDYSPPLGQVRDWAVVHFQMWSFKPEGKPISSREVLSI